MGTEWKRKELGAWAKTNLGAGAVIAIVLGALAAVSSLQLNGDCERGEVECVPQAEADPIIAVGLAVALVLFIAAGLALASFRPVRPRWQIPLAATLGAAGGLGWVVWFLMAATAGIRATT